MIAMFYAHGQSGLCKKQVFIALSQPSKDIFMAPNRKNKPIRAITLLDLF